MDRLRYFLTKLQASFWFLPTCLVLASGVLGVVLVEVDHHLDVDLDEKVPRIFAVSAEGAQGMLQAIATSMITVAGVIFSITILILNEASNQYSPRILRNFVRDRNNQVVLGVFLAIFVYCVVVLRSIHDIDHEKFVPQIAILGGVALSLVGIGVLIFFIHHIAYSIQASTILQRATMETLEEINTLYPENVGVESDIHPNKFQVDLQDQENWQAVKAGKSGYLEMTSADGLLEFAEEHDTIIRLEYRIGEFVIEDTPLVSFYGKEAPSDADVKKLLRGISITAYRTIEQDASFGIRQLVDIALKALSPSMNDTTTAIMCIDHLTTILARLVQRRMESPYRLKDKKLRVIASRPGFEDLLGECVTQIRQNAGGNVAVLNRLVCALDTVVPLTASWVRLEALEQQLDLIKRTIDSTIPFPPDKAQQLIECDRTAEKIKKRKFQSRPVMGGDAL